MTACLSQEPKPRKGTQMTCIRLFRGFKSTSRPRSERLTTWEIPSPGLECEVFNLSMLDVARIFWILVVEWLMPHCWDQGCYQSSLAILLGKSKRRYFGLKILQGRNLEEVTSRLFNMRTYDVLSQSAITLYYICIRSARASAAQ